MQISFNEIVPLFWSCNPGGHSSQSPPYASSVCLSLCVPPRVLLVTKLCVAWPGWRTLRLEEDSPAQPRQPHPVTEPGSETSWEPGAGAVSGLLSLSSLSPSQIQSHFEPGPATRPRQAVLAHPVYLHLNHQYTDLHLNAFSQRPSSRLPITSPPQAPQPRNWFPTASEVWKNIYSRLAQSWL